jgi:hypothetical protein
MHVGGVSMQGLRNILGSVGIEGATKKHMEAANAEFFSRVRNSISLPLEKGGEFTWHFADPARALQELVDSSWELQEIYARAAARKPCSQAAPWSMIIAFDEFTPGDMKKAAKRSEVYGVKLHVRRTGS